MQQVRERAACVHLVPAALSNLRSYLQVRFFCCLIFKPSLHLTDELRASPSLPHIHARQAHRVIPSPQAFAGQGDKRQKIPDQTASSDTGFAIWEDLCRTKKTQKTKAWRGQQLALQAHQDPPLLWLAQHHQLRGSVEAERDLCLSITRKKEPSPKGCR